ncbi:hypothetical protein B046DRAFT_00588 [Streptomyces sp. LamerLS-316]|nr:hypothetical protein B046DRAFT_00588 [Streptomyces sp. LamerLS-316]
MTPEVRTARLLLTPYTPGDEESFVALFQDVRVSRWMGDGPSPEADGRTTRLLVRARGETGLDTR